MATTAAIRAASADDAEGCAAVYAPYVRDTVITFEHEPPTPAEMASRIAAAQQLHAWLVLEESGRVGGYAYGHAYHGRSAYQWSCEVSVYLEMGRRRTGAGRALYEALFERLVQRGYRTAVAAMTLPNAPSAGLHAALGFRPAGTLQRIGFKHGAWHDVAVLQRDLVPPDGAAPRPLT